VNHQRNTNELRPKVLEKLNSKIENFNFIYRNYLETTSLIELYLILKETSNKFLRPSFSEDDPIVEFQMNIIEKFRKLAQDKRLQKQQFENLITSTDLRIIIIYVYILDEGIGHEEIISVFKSSFFLQPLWLQRSLKYFEKKINNQNRNEWGELALMINIIEKLNKQVKDPKMLKKIEIWRDELEEEAKNWANNCLQISRDQLEDGKRNKLITNVPEEILQINSFSDSNALEVPKVKNLRRRKKSTKEQVEAGILARIFYYMIGILFAVICNIYRLVRH
jgi:hypothetical protein